MVAIVVAAAIAVAAGAAGGALAGHVVDGAHGLWVEHFHGANGDGAAA